MATQKYDRFKAAPWFQQDKKPAVLIGGAGGIGSWLTLLLNRAGFETYVFDFDRLEEINMAGQLFMHKSIGKPKVEALSDIVREICREEIIPYEEKMDATSITNDIVFSAFDNMLARKNMFQGWLAQYKGSPNAVFIDGRLTMEQLTVFTVKGNDAKAIEEYEKVHLFDDSKVEDLPCSAKQTSHGAAMIAAKMVAKFTNFYCGLLDKDEERPCRFFWQHFIPAEYTFERDANAIEEAQIAMQEDTLNTSESPAGYHLTDVGHELIPPRPTALDAMKLIAELQTNGVDITPDIPDVPGIGGETFPLRFGNRRSNTRETLTIEQAAERAYELGLGERFDDALNGYLASHGVLPSEVIWMADSFGSGELSFEEQVELRDLGGAVSSDVPDVISPEPTSLPEIEEEEEDEIFDEPDEEEELDETPDPDSEITIGGTSISLDTLGINLVDTSIQSVNLNAVWTTDSTDRVIGITAPTTDVAQYISAIDPYVPNSNPSVATISTTTLDPIAYQENTIQPEPEDQGLTASDIL